MARADRCARLHAGMASPAPVTDRGRTSCHGIGPIGSPHDPLLSPAGACCRPGYRRLRGELLSHCARVVSRPLDESRCARRLFPAGRRSRKSPRHLAEAPLVSRWIRFALARASYRLPLPMLCVSHWLRRQVRRPDAVVVGQGIDLAVFRARNRDQPPARVAVGTIGAVARAKGYADVLAALAQFADASFDLVIAVLDDRIPMPASPRAVQRTAVTEPGDGRLLRGVRYFRVCLASRRVWIAATRGDGVRLRCRDDGLWRRRGFCAARRELS